MAFRSSQEEYDERHPADFTYYSRYEDQWMPPNFEHDRPPWWTSCAHNLKEFVIEYGSAINAVVYVIVFLVHVLIVFAEPWFYGYRNQANIVAMVITYPIYMIEFSTIVSIPLTNAIAVMLGTAQFIIYCATTFAWKETVPYTHANTTMSDTGRSAVSGNTTLSVEQETLNYIICAHICSAIIFVHIPFVIWRTWLKSQQQLRRQDSVGSMTASVSGSHMT